MKPQYVRINPMIDAELRKLQGALIGSLLTDISYNTVINMVLVAGLLAADKLDQDDWLTVRNYWLLQERDVPSVVGKATRVADQVREAA